METNNRDYLLEKLRETQRLYCKIEKVLITTNPTLYESDLENYSDSYKWSRLPIPGDRPETVSDMILSGLEYFPNDCLFGILLEVLKNRVPKGIRVQGISIDRIGNSYGFCISGSTSLKDLQNISEQYKHHGGFEDEM